MPALSSRAAAVLLDMAGCPNRCRHCWLGNPPNRRMSIETLQWVAQQFRAWAPSGQSAPCGERAPFFQPLTVSTWFREPDFADDYRRFYELERELGDGEPARFELLSIWRLAHDEGYARWARDIGTEACQITFFGLERNTDYFVRRRGAFRDSLLATERLLEVGIRPRWQVFMLEPVIPELPRLVDLIQQLDLERRVRALGHEFAVFLNIPSPDGEAFHIEHLRPTEDALSAIPANLAAKTCQHFGAATLQECLGKAEGELLRELVDCDQPFADMPSTLAFMVTPDLDVYSNIAEPQPWWRLGNLREDGLDAILDCFQQDANPGLRAQFHLPVSRLARAYGRAEGRQLYSRGDLIRRWLRLWGEEQAIPAE
ncbi:MAG: radical SAM protein [Chloroflexi bacterium]|nr:radical SAM protein [Chloroflexota bacterium]